MAVPLSIVVSGAVGAFALVSAGLAVWAFAIIINLVMSQTITQCDAPAHQIGKVVAATRWLTLGVEPLGAVVGGWIAAQWGVIPQLWIAAFGLVTAGIWLYCGGNIRQADVQAIARDEETPSES